MTSPEHKHPSKMDVKETLSTAEDARKLAGKLDGGDAETVRALVRIVYYQAGLIGQMRQLLKPR